MINRKIKTEMTPDELERGQEAVRSALFDSGMPWRNIEPDVITDIAVFVHDSRLALNPVNHALLYRAFAWARDNWEGDIVPA